MPDLSDLSDLSPWIATVFAAILVVAVALLVHRVAAMVLLRATGHTPVLQSIVRACQRPTRVLLPVLALQLVWQAATDDMRFILTIRHLNGLVLIASVTWLIVSAIGGMASGIIGQHP